MTRFLPPPFDDILQLVGGTPIVRLRTFSAETGMNVYAKLEMMNPGGSIKDRIAPYIVREAEQKGWLREGGTIIEPTSGNTGAGLAILAAVRGYRTIFTMPDKVSPEKRELLQAFGAQIVLTPATASPDSPEHYVNVAIRLAKETPGSYMPNQYRNLGNPDAHYHTTGPEIWEQMKGEVDCFVATVGTGGTISGSGRYLKEKKNSVFVIGVEPIGSLYHNQKFGTEYPLHPYLLEGIGEDFVPETFDSSIVDDIVRVPDLESFETAKRLARDEGILAGGSSGAALLGAVRWLANRGRSTGVRNTVVILPDTGRGYLSKFYNDKWLKSNAEGKRCKP